MPSYSEYQPRTIPVWVPALAAAFVLCAGIIILYFWSADALIRSRHLSGIASIKANSAAGLVLAGIALGLQLEITRALPLYMQRIVAVMAHFLALCVLTLGAVTLAQDFFNIDAGIDQLLFSVGPEPGILHPGRMSPLVALGFVISGTSLFLLDYVDRQHHYPAEYFALGMAGIMGIPLIGYLYRVTMIQLTSSQETAPQMPVIFLVLALGILSARPAHRIMSLWTSNTPGGHLLRRLLPKSLLLLVFLELLTEWGMRKGFYSQDKVSPLLILLCSAMLFILFCRAAVMLNREYDVRLQGEAALSESNALMRAVSDNTPDAIFVKDRGGRMIFANPAMLHLLAKNSEDVIGRTSRELYADSAYADMVDANDRSVIASGTAKIFEATVPFPGGMRTLYSTKAPWLTDQGDVLGLVGISTDITDRKRMEDALKAHETQLEALVAVRTAEVNELLGHIESVREEEKRAIARELHDDMGSALTALSMHLAILFKQMPADPAFTERAVQVKALLSSVTDATRRIQIGLRPDKLDIFGIKFAISEQALEFEKYTGITCNASLPDEDLMYASQLDIALFRMVQEALNNIAKHARATHVDVILDDNETELVLTIRDNGIGITPVRTNNTVTHGLRGMRERATYLGGQVKIASLPGKGTTITVTLPKIRADNVAAAEGDFSLSSQSLSDMEQ